MPQAHTIMSEWGRPTFKRRLVNERVAQAAIVFEGDNAIAWWSAFFWCARRDLNPRPIDP